MRVLRMNGGSTSARIDPPSAAFRRVPSERCSSDSRSSPSTRSSARSPSPARPRRPASTTAGCSTATCCGAIPTRSSRSWRARPNGSGWGPASPTRDARAERHRQRPRHARRDQRRPDGPGHRARRQRPTRAGQAADHDGQHRGGRPGHPGARRRRDRSTTRGRRSTSRGRAAGRCRSGSRATARWRWR